MIDRAERATASDGPLPPCAVVTPRGELDVESVDELDALLGSVPDDVHLVVDLSDTTFVDSRALRVLVRAAARREAAGSRMVLAGPVPVVERILTRSRLDEVLVRAESVASARQLLGEPRQAAVGLTTSVEGQRWTRSRS